MGTLKLRAIFFYIIVMLSCYVLQAQNALPKIENYTKAELVIRVAPFGLDGNEITVGRISVDGKVHFKWPEIDEADFEASGLFMLKLESFAGMVGCNDKEIEEKKGDIKAVDTKFFLLYNQYGDAVGSLHPSTHKDIRDANSLTVGSYFSWFYSNGDGALKGACTQYNTLENNAEPDKNSVRSIKISDLNFKKGWNIVEHRLLEVNEQKSNDQSYRVRFKEQIISIDKIPISIKWNMEYRANDELLRIERELVAEEPIDKTYYENWLPKKMGDLKRTNYEIGKKMERMPTLNNVQLLFEKGAKRATVTIVDCAGDKKAVSGYTMLQDMASRDWKDKTKTGYDTATKMDDTRVVIEYNENEVKTVLSYNSGDRFVVKAEATNIKPEELWEQLKTLHVEKLVKK